MDEEVQELFSSFNIPAGLKNLIDSISKRWSGLKTSTPTQMSVYNSATHRGTQPIRVLQYNLLHTFEETNLSFKSLTKYAVKEFGFSPGIQYHLSEKHIFSSDGIYKYHTPYLKGGRRIHIHETFLSYVWCVAYALITLYEEQVAKTDLNREAGRKIEFPNIERIRSSEKLMAYAFSLLHKYTPWDTSLPNPEKFDLFNQDWIYKINGIYLYAINFILQHEFSHALKQHGAESQKYKKKQVSKRFINSISRSQEKEADLLAFEALRSGYTIMEINGRSMNTQISSDLGNLVGLCSLLFLSDDVTFSTTHPSISNRLLYFFKYMELEPNSSLWGVACVAIKLWAKHYKYNLSLPTNINTYEDLFNLMLNSVRELE